jgi:hypothetical protein
MLSPSLGAARLAGKIGPPVCLCGGTPAVDRPPSQCAGPPASCPLCHALDPGQASPYRLPHPPTQLLLIVQFTAGWTAPAAPAPPAAARSGTAPPLRAPGATGFFAMSCGSSMLAMILSCPPQCSSACTISPDGKHDLGETRHNPLSTSLVGSTKTSRAVRSQNLISRKCLSGSGFSLGFISVAN